MIHYLIDYESVHPSDVHAIADAETWVTVFVGAHQHRLPFNLAESMQGLGERGSYVKVAVPGKNALDFHLAYYLGVLAQRNPDGTFRVVSKDTGFDPLIDHLRGRGLRIERIAALGTDLDLLEAASDSARRICQRIAPATG